MCFFSKKLRTYRKFKHDYSTEKYLTDITDPFIRSSVAKLGLSNYKLMIEKGRHRKLEVKDRICTRCNIPEVDDEYHAVMRCEEFTCQRLELYNTLTDKVPQWDNKSDPDRFIYLMSINEHATIIGKFFHYIY